MPSPKSDLCVDPAIPTNIYLVTFGCPKNEVDAEVFQVDLQEHGFSFVSDPSCADILLVNTCGFIQEAVQENIEAILELSRYKIAGSCRYLVVVGCLVQRYGSSLGQALPEVDLFVGTRACKRLGKILVDYLEGIISVKVLIDPPYASYHEHRRRFPRRCTGGVSAYLKISEGCSNRCAYCSIPFIRGPLVSRPEKEILEEAHFLAATGAVEISLIGQDVTSYGRDLPRRRRNALVRLLQKLDRIESLRWIRLLYCHPSTIPDALLELFETIDKLCPYLDMPIQHVSDHILKAMNRPYTEAYVRTIIGKLRAARPDIALRTTVMVGFPGESEADVEALLGFLKDIEFHHLGAFCYSAEEGTPAYSRTADTVSPEEKQRRYRAVMELQASISQKKCHELVGTLQEVLVEGPHQETPLLLKARTKYQAPSVDGSVIINKGTIFRPGIAWAKITQAHVYDLVGELVTED